MPPDADETVPRSPSSAASRLRDQPEIVVEHGPDPGEPPSADVVLLDRLRRGDADAFTSLVDSWSPVMLRVARSFVSTDSSAQEVVQETWLAVLRGLDGFEGRSSLRTWVFRILTNLGKTRGVREARTVPWSSVDDSEGGGRTMDPSRFRGAHDQWPDHWTPLGAPRRWVPSPEEAVVMSEVRGLVAAALDELPERQRVVVSMRDVVGMAADEVCEALQISPENQRVLLHRGRARLRQSLEDYYRGGVTPS